MEYTHPEDIKMLQCVGTVRICEIPISQTQSAFNALLCLQPPHPKDIIPRRGLITGAKIRIFLHKYKKMAIFFAIFSLEDARGASYSLEMIGEEYPNMIRD